MGTLAQHLSVAEVASRLGVHERTIRRLIQSGRLPAKRIGRVLRIDPDHLAVFEEVPRLERTGPREPVRTGSRGVSQAAALRLGIIRDARERSDP